MEQKQTAARAVHVHVPTDRTERFCRMCSSQVDIISCQFLSFSYATSSTTPGQTVPFCVSAISNSGTLLILNGVYQVLNVFKLAQLLNDELTWLSS